MRVRLSASRIGHGFERSLLERTTGRTRSGEAIGRPRRDVDLQAVATLRAVGRSWREIAQALHVPRRTLTRTWALEHNPGLDSAA